jgi:hypothetical protein
MRVSPIPFVAALLAASLATLYAADTMTPAAGIRIDRHALVARHNIQWNEPSGQIPLGNGEFCFNVDATGLQTFGGNSMSHWGWHSFPLPEGWMPDRVPPTGTFQKGRNAGGDNFPAGTEAIRTWMFDNPHIMNLGRLRLMRPEGRVLVPGDITGLRRTVDLWTGVQTSHYQIAGQTVTVETCVHPTLDMVAVRIESPLVASGELVAALDFAYPSLNNSAWVGDFSRTIGHATTVASRGERRLDLTRQVDAVAYHAVLAVAQGGSIHTPGPAAAVKKLVIKHAEYGIGDKWADVTAKVAAAVKADRIAEVVNYKTMNADPAPGMAKGLKVTYTLDGQEAKVEIPDNQTLCLPAAAINAYTVSARGTNVMAFVCAFSATPLPANLPSCAETKVACAARWEIHWTTGGAIDLSGSKDARWRELERRIVLSQYLMAAMSAGSWPSSENGLMGIDPWRGQFHMEMVWWHLAHYALWDRWPMANDALRCYARFTPAARELAAQLGYKGLKWQKSVGPEGRTAPWVGNQVLLWKQPHPIFFAELEYRLRPTRATLDKWAGIVEGTAEHMADYPTQEETTGRYSLTPAMPPSEQGITRNTVFDLAYWRWSLDKAQEWRQRRGLAREPHWDQVRHNLAPLPVVDGVFVHSAEWSDTYTRRAFEHPDPVGVFGMLPPMAGVDAETARRTVAKVWTTWDWKRCWGWDFPWMAMAGARTGQPKMAVDALLHDNPKNSYSIAGINGGWYLPGNGGLLYAVAMMAAGWDGGPTNHAPGFPADGNWVVKWEGLKKAP